MSKPSEYNATERVLAAIANTPPEYWRTVAEQRSEKSDKQIGSYVPGKTPDELMETLLHAEWVDFDHKDVEAPARAYRSTCMAGIMGMVNAVADRDMDELVKWEPRRGDPTQSEPVLLTKGVKGSKWNYICLLVGPDDKGEDTVWTWFVGPPIHPARVASEKVAGETMTVERMFEDFGAEWCQLRND